VSGPALIDQVVAADREWFERHRSERHRVRSYVRDEFDRHEDAWESVVVTAIRSPREIGLRHRLLIGAGPVEVDDRGGPLVLTRSPLAAGERPTTGCLSLVFFEPGENAEALLERMQDAPTLSDDLWDAFNRAHEEGQL
jgi:hypothetical protein